MMRRLLIVLLALFLTTLATTGAAGAAPPMLPGMDEMMAQGERDMLELRGLTGKDFEIAYMQKMRMHHMAAIEMAQLVATRATHAELKTLAQLIIADQRKEVGQLEGWLKAWYGIATPLDMPMAGMDTMMAALMALNGADFEQGWLQMMVHHHQSAVDMSALAPGRATHPELLTFARGVIAAQTKEIAQMRGWAQAWYGFDPMPMNHGGMPMPGLPNTGGGGLNAGSTNPVGGLLAALLGLLLVGAPLRRRLAR